MSSYNDLYTWIAPMTLQDAAPCSVIEHSDTSVSVAISWNGFATELKTEAAIASQYELYYQALRALSQYQDVVVENHWLRTYDNAVAKEYWRYGNQHMVRAQQLGGMIRTELAEHLGKRAMSNQLCTILTIPAYLSPLAALTPNRTRRKNKLKAQRLLKIAGEFVTYLPGAKLLDSVAYEHFIWRTYHRDLDREGTIPAPNPRFRLSDRIAEKPAFSDGLLRLGDTYTKVALLVDYPDAPQNWFYQLANWHGLEIHITQIIKPVDTAIEKQRSASQAKRTQESASVIGGEDERGKLDDLNFFRSFIADNELAVFGNCYLIKVHHTDPDYLNTTYEVLRKHLRQTSVLHDQDEAVVRLYWRVSMPGQGYKTAFLRPDHTWQVAHMAPIIRFDRGDDTHLQMLRLTSDAQLVTLAYPEGGANQTVTGAKTGAGKGIQQVAQIAELFPLGTNYYIGEVGPTYKWVVEAYGGTYFHLDPNKTVVSPFPDYAMATKERGSPLDADIVGPTIAALMPLLVSPREQDIPTHVQSVGEQILQAMYEYTDAPAGQKAPTLANYHDFAEEVKDEFKGVQAEACTAIINNLNSFLSSNAGSRFAGGDTLDFNSGIVGVDFKPLLSNEGLAKFMLVFIALRFKQLAFANPSPCRIVLDELHEFSRIDLPLMQTLITQLTRMGRKEAGAFHGISQEVTDTAIAPGILNQISHRELLFFNDGHDEIADLFKLNPAVLARWKRYKDPETNPMPYRQCIKMVGERAFDLHLTFPQMLLDLGDSSPKGLALKEKIGKVTQDPIERLRLFREARAND